MIIGLLSIVAVLFVSTKLLKWGRNFCRERFEIDILGGARLALSVLSVIGVIVALIYNFATEGNFWDFWDVTKIILLVSSLAGIAYNILKSNRRDVPAILVCLALGVFQGVFGTLGCIGICLTPLVLGFISGAAGQATASDNTQTVMDPIMQSTLERADVVARQTGYTDANQWAISQGQINAETAYKNGWFTNKL